MKQLIMDLGLHNGDDTAFYLSQGYRVIAVDADHEHIERALSRFAGEIASGDLHLIHVALADTDGDREFYRSRANDQWSSLEYSLARRNGCEADTLLVECRHPRFLFEHFGTPHYLKIDLEGADRFVLAALAERKERPRYLSTEVGGAQDIDAVVALGYREFQLVDQSALPRKGNPSGPFGDALRGAWVSGPEAREQYVTARDRGDLRAPKHAWFDLHAR
jgi:FkbM family methyltransferase